MIRFSVYIIGLFLLCIGTIHGAVYLNLIPSGFTVKEYILFMLQHTETYGIPLGALLIQLSATHKKLTD
ncbi:hypothetical protein P6709_14645 [Jeotgalibacillus sp. ET6]|uniref:hypothetical protein n=1 Tax=Jeotgalibacillus sp. ET6 TaxID=3037260 RepID=UPI0024187FC3|nr:hypothetical protein [Jeotgalibacillus sp. ET6]MDG5472990.1 hypothetical protein [Jeotgalibacillus sp. ET6]